jgi:Zn-dependent protease
MDWESAFQLYVTLIVSLTFHEAAHAWLAMLGGDRTAYFAGQVTLNPIPHMQREPFGTIVLPLLGLLSSHGTGLLGYASAPVDPRWAERNPRKAALMSAGGPLANILLAAIAFAILYWIARPDTDTEHRVRDIAKVFLRINLLLAVFNAIPLPPLDGAGILKGLVPQLRPLYRRIESIPYGTLVVFVVVAYNLSDLYDPVYFAVDRWLPYSTLF